MDLLEKCKSLYSDLYNNVQSMDKVQLKLTTNISLDEFEDLSLKEFELAINISGAYNDLMYALEKVEKEEQNMGFFVRRVRRNVSKLMGSDVNNV